MSFANIGLHNFTQPGFNALQFSLMGLGLVFGGLLIIALYITLLPRLLELTQRKQSSLAKIETAADKNQKEEILLAIATAFHLHSNFPEGSERITWKSHGDMESPSPWLVSGRMHSLNIRKLPNTWKR
ncbi:MAG: OadG family protein [Proteobacteria bacterium]|nr:OadG family protein [Pseudomonadota bacterium]MBU1232778.1 OadG family protein [Pseudomonadota bacterium]MBU1418804.1 OadG family protein [Pseudomonadota bacterium]MBU1453512.1 OadG family protein [Pseudomonadota bacterium]